VLARSLRLGALLLLVAPWMPAPVAAQARQGFEGMWSDPPATPEGAFCDGYCTDAGLARLKALLDDPANDARSYTELSMEADNYQRQQYLRPKLSAAALKDYPLRVETDPGYLRCQPWGLARQMVARHQLEIRRRGDQLDMRYGEWDAKRTVYLDGRWRPANQPPSLMGHSVGRFDGQTLVIETTGLAPDRTPWQAEHSDQLRVVERYTRSQDGNLLTLTATFEDPITLTEPLVLKKVWTWAPKAEIAPYKDCKPPAEPISTGGRR
jgi:hypothetical protein